MTPFTKILAFNWSLNNWFLDIEIIDKICATDWPIGIRVNIAENLVQKYGGKLYICNIFISILKCFIPLMKRQKKRFKIVFRTPYFQNILRICFVPHKSQHFLKCFIPPQIITFFEMFHAPTNHDILENVSYPHKSDVKMFQTPTGKPGKCFIPRLQILRPGMQVKK